MLVVMRDDQCTRNTVLSAEFIAEANPDLQYFVNVYPSGYGSRVGFLRGIAELVAKESEERPIYRIVVRPYLKIPKIFD